MSISFVKSPIENSSFHRFFDIYNLSESRQFKNFPDFNSVQDDSNVGFLAIDEIDSKCNTLLNHQIISKRGNIIDGVVDSAWPMYCHDTRHTSRSPYSTANTRDEIWRVEALSGVRGGPAIGEDGTIYAGDIDFNAFNPDGSLKWKIDVDGWSECCPAIDENGIIYVGTTHGRFYALYPNGTIYWKYPTCKIYSSPVIADDGTIIFGATDNWNIIALNPNGTEKWRYHTNHVIYSSPAIGPDGTIYCGSHDTYLYALYPNNGSLKWKYKTGGWIRVSPCIGDDGTIYVVSLDNYLHAVNPDGSLKWKTDVGEAGTSPTIGWDGTIYAGYETLHAVDPEDGSVKWEFLTAGNMRGGTPCNSVDGTIYVGTSDGGQLIAINPDGTEKWREHIGACESPPAIGSDGIVYVGSDADSLYAFGTGEVKVDANGPYYGLTVEPVQFDGTAYSGIPPYSYLWIFGDLQSSGEKDPTHIYQNPGNYTVSLTVTDSTGNSTTDTTWAWIQETNNPPSVPVISGPDRGQPGVRYDYSFQSSEPDGTNQIWYYIEWGNITKSGLLGPYNSNTTVIRPYAWDQEGTFLIRCKALDIYGDESDWGEFEVNMEKSKKKIYLQSWFQQFISQLPIIQKL